MSKEARLAKSSQKKPLPTIFFPQQEIQLSTAIKTALKVALYDFFDGPLAHLNGQFMEKVNHHNRTKNKDFLMGPSVKLVLAIIDSGSQKKCA